MTVYIRHKLYLYLTLLAVLANIITSPTLFAQANGFLICAPSGQVSSEMHQAEAELQAILSLKTPSQDDVDHCSDCLISFTALAIADVDIAHDKCSDRPLNAVSISSFNTIRGPPIGARAPPVSV